MGTDLHNYFRSLDLAGCAGYGRKVKDYRYLAGLSNRSHFTAETSPSPGIAALQKSLKDYRKRIFKTAFAYSN